MNNFENDNLMVNFKVHSAQFHVIRGTTCFALYESYEFKKVTP